MNFSLLASIFGIAVLDSVNPSAIVVTLAQLSGGKNVVTRCLFYILGIFLTYLIIGLVLYTLYFYFGSSFQFDFGPAKNFIDQPPIWSYYLQILLGPCLVIYALYYFRPNSKKSKPKTPSSKSSKNSIITSFLLGVTVTGVESVTALPYFGAISTLYIANVNYAQGVLLLIVYNIIFISPPLFLVVIYKVFASRFASIVSNLGRIFSKYGFLTLKYGFIALGLFLFLEALLVLNNI
jgi:cytochrome c biogenesis protein CcdA